MAASPKPALAWLLRRSLERRLAAGEDPLGDELLLERAAQIGGRKARVDAAEQLEHAIAAADAPPSRFEAAVPVCRREIIRALPTLLRLIERLRDGLPAWPAGVAAVRQLLADGGGPLYVERRAGALRRGARAALRELEIDPAVGPRRLSPR
jgi:hypothetical protein